MFKKVGIMWFFIIIFFIIAIIFVKQQKFLGLSIMGHKIAF